MGRRQLTWYSTATCSGVNTSVGPIHLDSTMEQIAITCSKLLRGRTQTDEHLAFVRPMVFCLQRAFYLPFSRIN